MSRPWFCRVWAVQEFVLARKVLLYWGTTVLKYDHLRDCNDICWSLDLLSQLRTGNKSWERYVDAYNGTDAFTCMLEIRERTNRASAETFSDLLTLSARFQATGTRDHV